MCSNSAYYRLYNYLSTKSYPLQKLEHVKNEIYGDIIKSKRQSERIHSIDGLLKVLQKRDYINPDKYETLLRVAEVLEISPPSVDFQATSANPNQNNRVNQQDVEFVLPRFSQNAKERAHQMIASDIGQKWPDFARALGVREGYIDNLHSETNHTKRVYKILKFHEDNCDPRFWRSSLLEALTVARRNDLRRTVQNVFDIMPM